MKKIKILLVTLLLLVVCVGTFNVNAACGSGAQVGGEFVCLVTGATQGNANGTAYPENNVLVLKNYNGGNITYSSGIGDPSGPVTIKLIGDNYITANDSYGIGTFATGVNFIGDGTLTITSKLAIIGFHGSNTNKNHTLADTVNTIKIVAGNGTVKEDTGNETIVEDTEEENTDVVVEEEKEENSNMDFLFILMLVLLIIITIILTVIGMHIIKSNKK